MSEDDRVRSRYAERDASQTLSGFWTLTNPVVLHLAQERERVAIAALARYTEIGLRQARMLDVGCGWGVEFANYLRWGMSLENLVGVDLMLPRLQEARRRYSASVVNASGAALPFLDGCFDVVCQNVVFSSIIDNDVKKQVAREMLRVLRRGGLVLWYDAFRTRSRDVHFRAVPMGEVQSLFPDTRFTWHRLTTDLGLLKRLNAAFGPGAMSLFDLSGLLKTHLLAIGVKS
jgi:SAM-dependent methyltransferase